MRLNVYFYINDMKITSKIMNDLGCIKRIYLHNCVGKIFWKNLWNGLKASNLTIAYRQ